MSYAGRLVAMTGRATPAARPVVHEVVESAETSEQPPAHAPVRGEPAVSAPSTARTAMPAAPAATEPASYVIREIERPAPAREVTRIVDRTATPAPPARRSPPPAVPAHEVVHREQTVVHDWLAERPDGADPLESLQADDEVRELLRAVRGWTAATTPAAAPAPSAGEPMPAIEIHELPALTPAPAAVRAHDAAPRHDEPVQVSIGNVTITIEDAPPPSRRPSAAAEPAVDVAGRLARHYLRGV